MSRFILRRTHAFRAVFGLPGERTRDQEVVLKALAEFCRANRSSVIVSPVHKQIDPLATCVAEGRREVFNRISQFIHLDQDELIRIINEAEKHDD
ncbi:hypothetical protein M2403_002038 [Rahnella sp. BIGb0603]|uniref:Bbp19 family protein n=1 Tax=Rahnella sp. BIGb0603 TaxID=2940612 RepID=UPI00216A464F|nr:GTP-binding protein [Rahnella sp. BIGb0603]MCS3423437.1 hypothetical protein [Rahnella sp. BIGb0603]